ncbi:hypothetical protein FHP25_40470 [Vineibacter terrae]|uniref:IS110 family transposase n=1 Tax=Vineibacter terrae TaxID=2586908 RepID=A0A5C8P5L3_9HYPH|nr:hypothetical protein FHP25_40470 [Vineibacter terrae]
MARKLMVALWRFLEHGLLPEGRRLERTAALIRAAASAYQGGRMMTVVIHGPYSTAVSDGSHRRRWFEERAGTQKGRTRRVAIVALARKLMVALWRFLEHGLLPEGAVLSAPQR